MYFLLLLLIVLFVPLPVMTWAAFRGATPYRAVLRGLLAVAVGTILLFIVAAAAGQPVGETLREDLHAAAELLADDSSLAGLLGMKDASHAQRAEALRQVYDYAVYAFPAALFMWASIIAYFEYMLFARVAAKREPRIQRMPPLKYFSLPRNALIGFILLFVLSWLTTAAGLLPRETLYLNSNMLFEFIFSVQGVAVLFFFCDSKRIPKAVAIIATVLLLSLSFGKTLLFLLGITDLAFGLRARMSQKLRQ